MAISGLTPGEEYLRNAAQEFFKDLYGSPKMYLDTPLHKDLRWTPALRFTIHDHINVFVEVSETNTYPRLLELKVADVLKFPQPIAVYTTCPEDVFLAQRRETVRLRSHGFGLITVNSDWHANREFTAIPLVQIISKREFENEIAGLRSIVRQRLCEAYDDYTTKPVNGVKFLTEIVEGMVISAGKNAINKGYLQNSILKKGTAFILDEMYKAPGCSNARAAIGGVINYNSQIRNLNHHWPKSKKLAYKKYANCRHAFLEGLKQIQHFKQALRNVGLSGGLR